jgi:hypothetical protein
MKGSLDQHFTLVSARKNPGADHWDKDDYMFEIATAKLSGAHAIQLGMIRCVLFRRTAVETLHDCVDFRPA